MGIRSCGTFTGGIPVFFCFPLSQVSRVLFRRETSFELNPLQRFLLVFRKNRKRLSGKETGALERWACDVAQPVSSPPVPVEVYQKKKESDFLSHIPDVSIDNVNGQLRSTSSKTKTPHTAVTFSMKRRRKKKERKVG